MTSSAVEGNQWFLNGNAITSATQTTFQPTAPGIHKVKVTIETCSSEFSNEFPIIVTGDITQTILDVKIYPNPATDLLAIELPVTNTRSSIHLLTMDGRIMDSLETAKETVEIDVSRFATGIYLIKVQNKGKMYYQKFVKQ